MSYILAIDMGTSSAKAALVSNRGQIAAAAIRPIASHHLPGGGVEQDPADWWRAVVGASREALAAAAVPARRIAAVRCATQWAVTVPVDSQGRALARAVSWMDTRGAPYSRRLAGGPLSVGGHSLAKLPRWLRLTGGAPILSGMDGLGHLLFFKHERPRIYAEAAAFLEPMDYLGLRLSGRCAASFGTIYPYWLTDNRDVERVRYDRVLLRRAGIAPEKMPELVPVDTVLGEVTPAAREELGLAAGTLVLSGLSDAQGATAGAGIAHESDGGYFSIGTTAWLSCLVPGKKTDLRRMLATEPAALPGRHQVVAEQGAAGRCLDLAGELLLGGEAGTQNAEARRPDRYGELERLAAAAPAGSGGLIFAPWLTGVSAPREDPHTRGAFFNLTLGTTRAECARAAMEGIAYNLRWLRDAVEPFAGRRFERLNFIGGAALSPVWCQIIADVLGCRIGQVANPRYANAVGTALTGFVALGKLTPGEIPGAVDLAAEFEPDPVAGPVHDRQFEHFLSFYRANRRPYRRLHA